MSSRVWVLLHAGLSLDQRHTRAALTARLLDGGCKIKRGVIHQWPEDRRAGFGGGYWQPRHTYW